MKALDVKIDWRRGGWTKGDAAFSDGIRIYFLCSDGRQRFLGHVKPKRSKSVIHASVGAPRHVLQQWQKPPQAVVFMEMDSKYADFDLPIGDDNALKYFLDSIQELLREFESGHFRTRGEMRSIDGSDVPLLNLKESVDKEAGTSRLIGFYSTVLRKLRDTLS